MSYATCVVLLAAFVAGTFPATARAQLRATPVDWQTVTSGDLNGVRVTVTGFETPLLQIISNRPYTDPAFSAAPLASAEAIEYGAANDWTATFSQPVNDLVLYVDLWRGSFVGTPEPSTSYTFNRPFVVLSGLEGGSVSGNTLTLPSPTGNNFHNGVIQFPGAISSLSVDAIPPAGVIGGSGQILTFAVVPEPGTMALPALALAATLCRRRRA